MTGLVLDASVLVAAAVDRGREGEWAEGLIESAQLLAPHLAVVEATNILRRLERAGRLTPGEAGVALRDLLLLDLGLFAFEPFADRVWELRRNLTAYDAWYVAVAEAVEVPLATLDQRLARSAGPRCEFRTPA